MNRRELLSSLAVAAAGVAAPSLVLGKSTPSHDWNAAETAKYGGRAGGSGFIRGSGDNLALFGKDASNRFYLLDETRHHCKAKDISFDHVKIGQKIACQHFGKKDGLTTLSTEFIRVTRFIDAKGGTVMVGKVLWSS